MLYAKGGTTSGDSARIYVADLAAYNEGKLVGEWIDLDDYTSGSEVMGAIGKLLKKWSKKQKVKREEYAIHDIENFPKSWYSEGMSETSFDKYYEVKEVADKMDLPVQVILDWINDNGVGSPSSAEDAYQGKYDNMEDFAERMVDEGVVSGVDSHIYISDTDRRIIAGEEADNFVDNAEDDEIIAESNMDDDMTALNDKQQEKEDLEEKLAEAQEALDEAESEDEPNQEDVDAAQKVVDDLTEKMKEYEDFDFDDEKEKLVDTAKENARSSKYDSIYEELSDPIQYFVEDQGMYSKEDLLTQSFIRIDYESLAKELSHDYNEVEHDGEVYIFSSNY